MTLWITAITEDHAAYAGFIFVLKDCNTCFRKAFPHFQESNVTGKEYV